MTRLPILRMLALLAVPAAPASAQISYDVSFPNAVHHEARIVLTATRLPAGPVTFHMSRSSPGRYALHEFAKNVYDVAAEDGEGHGLRLTRPDPYSWQVPVQHGSVVFRYTLFADWGDGTYAQVDTTHAHLNMPATFMWVAGMDTAPIRVRFHPPDGLGWKVATQLVPTPDPMTFTAPGLQYFMDSPTELSDFTLRTWTVTLQGRTDTLRLALHHTGTDAEADAYAEMAKKVTAQDFAVFGGTAGYDHHTYTFIADYLPWASGDGMEHRNSTIISSTSSLARNMNGLLGTLSHEFFHSWNMERIRARAIEPFDFTRANMSGELWFGEGFTSYYGPLMIRRAGLMTDQDFARNMGGAINGVLNSPGRKFFSAVEMSMQAPFVDAATSVDPTNRVNTFISYYTWGQVLALGVDLTLRSRYHLTLDDFMRRMWERHGKPERPYTLDDLQRTLGQFTGDSAFAADFFRRYVRGHDIQDLAPLVAQAGFLLRPREAGKPWLGNPQLGFDSTGILIRGFTTIGSPLYQAGIDADDRIETLDGHAIHSQAEFQAVLDNHHPGDTLAVEVVSHGVRKPLTVVLAQDPRVELVPGEDAGQTLTDEQRRFREAWLGAR